MSIEKRRRLLFGTIFLNKEKLKINSRLVECVAEPFISGILIRVASSERDAINFVFFLLLLNPEANFFERISD